MNTLNIIKKLYQSINDQLTVFKLEPDFNALFKDDFRGYLFSIEGILRFNLKSVKNKMSKKENLVLEEILTETKKVEDFLGSYSLLSELIEYSEKEGLDKNKTDKMRSELKQKEKEGIDILNQYHKDAQNHCLKLEQISWPKKDQKFIKKTLKYEIKRINKKVSEDLKDLIMAKEYGYEELEEGFHEFRRAIRWISIYIQAYKPFFKLSDLPKKLTKEDKILIEKFKDSPFTQLSSGDDLISIDCLLYYKLSHHINNVGEIKDQGEIEYYLTERNFVLNKKTKIETLAHKSYKEFIEDDVFQNFIL